MNFQDHAQTLMRLGLTYSQAKVYLALVRLAADSKGITIAKFADVPRQDVYRLLAELQQIGIVHKTLTKPSTFRGIAPEEAVDILLKRKMGDFTQLKSEADNFVRNAKDFFGNLDEQLTLHGNEQFALISEREAITYKARILLEKIEVSLKDITPYNELSPWLTVLSKSVDDALCRGVKILWITEKPARINPLPKFLKNHLERGDFRLRFISDTPKAKMGIFDNKEIILGIFTHSGFARSPALWSNNPSFVAIADSHFEACWKNGLDPEYQEIDPIINS